MLLHPDSPDPESALRVRHPRRGYGRRALAADLAVLLAAMGFVALLSPTTSPTGEIPREPLAWSLAFGVAVVLAFRARGMYSPPLRLDVLDTLRAIVSGTAVAATFVITARVIVADDSYVAAETVRHWLVALPLLAAGRSAVLWREGRARRHGGAGRRTLVVGAGQIGRLTANRLLEGAELGLRPVAFFDDDPLPVTGGASAELPVLGSADGLERILEEHGIDQAVITFSTATHQELLDISRTCLANGATVSVVPRLFELEGERVETEHLGGLPLVQLRPADPTSWRLRVKYAVDRVLAFAALMLLSPLLVASALAVLMSMGAPLFYRQRRLGRNGHEFEMLKLRTLREAGDGNHETADADWAADQLGASPPEDHVGLDRRMTRVGAFLRRYSLDELPQLWNVVRGDMSLVGPRPERVTYARHFEDAIYRYEARHRMKSGLTGWAQVNGLRGKTPLTDRVEWDNHYIENWSPWLDFKILAMTLGCVFRGQPEQ